GNYKQDEVKNLLTLFKNNMKQGDKMLIGIDLKKNPSVILNAYSDPHGITKKFNLNLLIRINRELQADFKYDDFDFYCHYNPISGEVRSYLVSLKDQYVKINSIEKTIHFKQNEIIWTELSKKYNPEEITEIANETGFKVLENFMDCKHYFTDSLWEKV
ncbi:MAG: L-histidine N(alpha)-methyltransferase, partial [Flavobacteriaceae bacterium]|nr:L-histidine N(alpha)-methyltransferase [Flavobacteriaceae bacterium]